MTFYSSHERFLSAEELAAFVGGFEHFRMGEASSAPGDTPTSRHSPASGARVLRAGPWSISPSPELQAAEPSVRVLMGVAGTALPGGPPGLAGAEPWPRREEEDENGVQAGLGGRDMGHCTRREISVRALELITCSLCDRGQLLETCGLSSLLSKVGLRPGGGTA